MIMEKKKVLFVCIHNSGRSQMAEALLNSLAGDRFEAHSAGMEPGALNLLAVDVMGEIGIDISMNRVKGVFDFIRQGRLFHYVITVCDETSGGRCPVFPGYARRLHWNFPDPSAVEGTREERLAKVRVIRDQIRARIESWINEDRT